MDYKIMPMKPEHCEGKAYVHYKAWQETYRGLMPDEYLDKRTYEQCLQNAMAGMEHTFVAVAEGEVAGFIRYSPEARKYTDRPDYWEIHALYVLKKYQGYGIGRSLVEQCLQKLPHRSVVLFVLKGNENAIGFYKRMGFSLTGKEYYGETSVGRITELEMILENASAYDR